MRVDGEPGDPRRDETDGRPADPVAFAPTRLGGPGGGPRRPRIAAVLVVLALVVAVLKPWDGIAPLDAPTTAMASPTPSPSAASQTPARTPEVLTDPALEVLAVTTPRRERGLRLLVQAPATGAEDGASRSLAEQWVRVPDGQPGPTELVSDTPVRLLGITAAPSQAVLDIRVWHDAGADGWRWLETTTLASDRPAADLLLLPPRVGGMALPSWPAGRYRLDLLMGTWIDQLELVLDAPTATNGAVALDPPPLAPGDAVPAVRAEPRVGPYAVAGGALRPLAAGSGPLLDAAAAWLDTADLVARQALPGAMALGVTLPLDATDMRGTIRRLAPEPVIDGPAGRPTVRAAADGTQHPGLEWVRGQSRAWAPGVYALEATWRDGDGSRAATWHIELLPGSAGHPRALLEAARRYATYARGFDDVEPRLIVGRPWRNGMEAGSQAVAMFPLGGELSCGDTRLDEPPAAVGIALPSGAVLVGAEAYRIRQTGGREAAGIRVVPEAAPGLALLAPRDAPRFRPDTYDLWFTVQRDGGERTHEVRVCLGPAAG